MSNGGSLDFFNDLGDKLKEQNLPHMLIASTREKDEYVNTIRSDLGDIDSLINFKILLIEVLKEIDELLDADKNENTIKRLPPTRLERRLKMFSKKKK